MAARPPDVSTLFREGARLRWSGQPDSEQTVVDAGSVDLPTGRLVACDPLWSISPPAFVASLPPGRYPVSLAVCRWDSVQLVAAARLTVRDLPVVAWEPALREGDPPYEGRLTGFDVESGFGAYVDASALAPLLGPRDVADQLSSTVVDSASGSNAVVFRCGDGIYPTWIGRTAAREPACFVTDLLVINYSLGPT